MHDGMLTCAHMRATLLALATVMAACGGGGGNGGEPDAGGGGEQCVSGDAFDVNGLAGVLATLNVHVNASGLVEADTTATLLLLMDITQNGTDVDVVATLCDIEIPDVPISGQDMPIHFEPGPGLIESVQPVAGTASLDGTTTCSTFASDPITLVIGARLDPPDQGVLPEANSEGVFTECAPAGTDCELAIGTNCVCDQESDGKPGATLLAMNTPAVMLEEVYVDLRTSFSLNGEVFSSDLIVGEIDATLEQGILACQKEGGDPCSPGEVGAIKNLNPDVTQQPGNPSTFRSVRVADGLTCAQLIEMKDQLFPR